MHINISRKELGRYYRKWIQGSRLDEALLPDKRGARPGSRHTPKEVERNIIKAYRRLRKHGGLNYETPFDKLQKVTELLS